MDSSSGRESAVSVPVAAARSSGGASALIVHAAKASRNARSASVRPPGRSSVIVADDADVLPGKARSSSSRAWTDGAEGGRNEA